MTTKTKHVEFRDDITHEWHRVPAIDHTADRRTRDRFMQQTIDLGTSSWGHSYKFKPESVYKVSKSFANAHYDQRIYKRKELMVQYLSSSAVRQWCTGQGFGLQEIRDMRGTTSWYDTVVMPAACAWYAEYHGGQHRQHLDTGLYHFIKTLMGAIVLTEETTFMDMSSL
jgi:hypothetical protein